MNSIEEQSKPMEESIPEDSKQEKVKTPGKHSRPKSENDLNMLSLEELTLHTSSEEDNFQKKDAIERKERCNSPKTVSLQDSDQKVIDGSDSNENQFNKLASQVTKFFDSLFAPGQLKNPLFGDDDNNDDERPENLSDRLRACFTPPPKLRRHHSRTYGLWKAHEDGLNHKRLRTGASNGSLAYSKTSNDPSLHSLSAVAKEEKEENRESEENEKVDTLAPRVIAEDDSASIKSTDEVRPILMRHGSSSSWGSSEGGFDHYDAWAVLKDEYTKDFVLASADDKSNVYSDVEGDDIDDQPLHFEIIGTSADDITAHPHVLSPPLMEALLHAVPKSLSEENFWLKFSLVRDGASFETLLRYARAAKHTILAIETTNGDVFGSFTSDIWRTNHGYFGSGEAFLWKVRQSRMTPCHSLREQAKMESDVLVYPYSGFNNYVQLCHHDRIALGGGDIMIVKNDNEFRQVDSLEGGQIYGFGLAINQDLLFGTSSPCATFQNPCLPNVACKGTVFEIANLEVWAFTPCSDVESAEKLELSKYIVSEKIIHPKKFKSARDVFKDEEMTTDQFYKRLGDGGGGFKSSSWRY